VSRVSPIDEGTLRSVADRIIFMDRGRIVGKGAPETIF
jgi:ABC-type polar amino acid transport system ATPase subunit